MEKLKSLLKAQFAQNLFFVGIMTMMINVSNYFYNLLLARELPDSDFALISVIIAVIYLIVLPASTIEAALTKFIARSLISNKSVEFNRLTRKFIAGAFMVGFLLFVLSPIVSLVADIELKYALLISVLAVPMSYSSLYRGVLMGSQYINTNYLIVFAETLLKISILYVFLQIDRNVNAGVASWGIPTIFSIFVGQIFMMKISASSSRDTSKAVESKSFSLVDSLPVMLALLFYYCGITLDLVLISHDIRAEYAALLLLGKMVYFATVLFTPVMFAMSAAEVDPKKRDRYFLAVISLSSMILGAILFVFGIFGDLIVSLVFADKYNEIGAYLLFYSVGMGLYALSFIGLNYLIIRDRLGVVWITAVLPIIQIGLFWMDNSSVEVAVRNQVVAFSILFVLISAFIVSDRFESDTSESDSLLSE